MSYRMVILGLIALLGCADGATIVEPNFTKTAITTEQMAGSLTLGKPGTRTIDPTTYCKVDLKLTGLFPNQIYVVKGTIAVTAHSDTASNRGSWSMSTYVLRTELPILRMYRMNTDYSLTALTPDYPLLQHPDVSVTNKCY